jgi:hypothetical protein
VKRNPVRSPLEPVEIVIEDDGEKSSYAGSPRHHTIRTTHSRRSTITNNNINNNNNNNTINNNNIHNNNNSIHPHEGVVVFQANVGLAAAPYASPLVFPPVCHTPPHRPATPLATATPPPSRAATPSQAPEEGGLLKSLLLDRTKRKRSSSKETETSPKKPASPLLVPIESPSDILRKRLMGFVEPSPAAPEPPRLSLEAASRPERPVARRPSEAPRRPSAAVPPPKAEGQPPQEEKATAGGSAEQKDKEAAYSKTSVLKHLLHRYTGTNQ